RFHFGLAHQLACRLVWRFGRVRILFPIRRRVLGTRCGDDTRDKDEGGTTNVDTRLICSHRRHLEAQKGSDNMKAVRLGARFGKQTKGKGELQDEPRWNRPSQALQWLRNTRRSGPKAPRRPD